MLYKPTFRKVIFIAKDLQGINSGNLSTVTGVKEAEHDILIVGKYSLLIILNRFPR